MITHPGFAVLLRLTSDCRSAASSFLLLRLQVYVTMLVQESYKIKTQSKINRWKDSSLFL